MLLQGSGGKVASACDTASNALTLSPKACNSVSRSTSEPSFDSSRARACSVHIWRRGPLKRRTSSCRLREGSFLLVSSLLVPSSVSRAATWGRGLSMSATEGQKYFVHPGASRCNNTLRPCLSRLMLSRSDFNSDNMIFSSRTVSSTTSKARISTMCPCSSIAILITFPLNDFTMRLRSFAEAKERAIAATREPSRVWRI
mmetsp:Transcript_16603/g.27440  ORF Transcript_16603/g.27440 Transcript_16603/m.27440 type:complete len:200 (-) Transcript_16603:1155-1754(-)